MSNGIITPFSLETTMKRSDLMLAALSVADGGLYTPVQVQKLFFLMDREIPALINGPLFQFEPYGPFDAAVYRELDKLHHCDMVQIIPQGTWSSYRLTKQGQDRGEECIKRLDPKAVAYIRSVSEFVRKLSFTELVSAIYKAYPEMRENSVFQH
jgi:hypothetical protein